MGFYSRFIIPRLLEWALGTDEAGRLRSALLASAAGEVLEIGFGTGLNLAHYPRTVTRITAIDSERMLPEKVQSRVDRSAAPVRVMRLDANGKLPFDDESFDTIVTTWTLCSIANVDHALAEARRVLRSDGRFLFLEHGRSDDPRVARKQDWWNPIQKALCSGCNSNRAIARIVDSAGFDILTLERFLMPNTPRILAEMFKGIAGKR